MVNEIRVKAIPSTSAPRAATAPAQLGAGVETPHDSATIIAKPQAAPVQAASPSAPATSAQAADKAAPGKPDFLPGQVLVKFDRAASFTDVKRLTGDLGLQTLRHFVIPPQMQKAFGGELYQFKLPLGMTVEEGIKQLSTRPGVSYVEPNYKIHVDDPKTSADASMVASLEKKVSEGTPNDLDPRLWGIRNDGQNGGTAGVDVGAVPAWATTTGSPNGQGPLICVIDTGLDYTHPDLAANVWTNPNEIAGDGVDNDGNGVVDDVHGANLNAKTGDPMDDNDHGTHCAGTIGAVGNNGNGIVGVNWNATIASAKFLDANGSGSYADAIDAVLYATAIGARVTSNSWGGGGFSQALYDAFKASPALHICAAGNNSADSDVSPSYPGGFDLDNVVSVAAIDRNGNLADFSNYGATSVDLAAPGVDIYSAKPGGTYQSLSGTSMATPHVTGVAGLVLSQFPNLTNDQLKARLLNSVVKEDELEGKVLTGGRVNAANALEDDSVAPADITDLAVVDFAATSLTLGFTATGDDGATGKAASYQVRYASQPITDQASWNAATPVKNLPAPGDAGTAERIRVQISPDPQAKTYYFALRAIDNMGNATGTATASGTSLPAVVAFADDFETDSGKWRAAGGWGRAREEGHGFVYQDSPGGIYPQNAKGSIVSTPIDLAGLRNPRLTFSARVQTEPGFDNGRVQVSRDGKTWDTLETMTGTHDWAEHGLDLKSYEGQKIRLRFELTSDSSVNYDGVSIDSVRIAGDPA